MSDNRFQDCHTAGEVLWRFRAAVAESILNIVDQRKRYELTTDALARIAELTPRTVTAEQRERAVPVVMAAMREAQERGTDIPSGNRWLDRIIDALGLPAAEPEPEHGVGCGCLPCLTRTGIKLTEPTPAPATPAVEPDWHVDFAPDELLTLAKIVNDFERLYNDVAQVVAHDTMRTTLDLGIIDGDLPVRVVCNDHGCWVLRIGGEQ